MQLRKEYIICLFSAICVISTINYTHSRTQSDLAVNANPDDDYCICFIISKGKIDPDIRWFCAAMIGPSWHCKPNICMHRCIHTFFS